MTMRSLDAIMAGQQAYYAAYAATYDGWIPRYVEPVYEEVTGLLARTFDGERVLELGCGGGHFTEPLSRAASAVTAVDGAAETLAILKARELHNVEPVQADVLDWVPDERWDGVFMANFVAHVPPVWLPRLWLIVDEAVRPGGRVVVLDVDERERFTEEAWWEESGVPLVRRWVDGVAYDVFKKFWAVDAFVDALAELGWTAIATPLDGGPGRGFVWYEVERTER